MTFERTKRNTLFLSFIFLSVGAAALWVTSGDNSGHDEFSREVQHYTAEMFGNERSILREYLEPREGLSDFLGYWEIKKDTVPQKAEVIYSDEDRDLFIKDLVKQWPDLRGEAWTDFEFLRGVVPVYSDDICEESKCQFYMLDGPDRAFLMVFRT